MKVGVEVDPPAAIPINPIEYLGSFAQIGVANFRNRNPERAAFQRGAHVVEILDFGGGQSGNDCPATRADLDETLCLEPDECFTNGNVADPKGSSDFVLT